VQRARVCIDTQREVLVEHLGARDQQQRDALVYERQRGSRRSMQEPHLNDVVNAHARLVSIGLGLDAYPNEVSDAWWRLETEAT
jgi:hypothetical protein